MSKRVQFSRDVDVASTFANDDYDRSAQAVAKLSYHDMVELLTMKSQWRRDMEQMLLDREMQEKEDMAAASADSSASSTTSEDSNESPDDVYTTEICI